MDLVYLYQIQQICDQDYIYKIYFGSSAWNYIAKVYRTLDRERFFRMTKVHSS